MNADRRTFLAILVSLPFLRGHYLQAGNGSLSWRVEHLPLRFTRRSGDLTANITGRIQGDVELHYQVNEGAWHTWKPMQPQSPRTPPGFFTIELLPEQLVEGANRIRFSDGQHEVRRTFIYDSTKPSLPQRTTWLNSENLDVQDGAWEFVPSVEANRVRPVPGTEAYDRINLASGAFSGARRVSCELLFFGSTHRGKPYGFGFLPLWGGHVESDPEIQPRRGWRFGIAWFYSNWNGFGVEFSEKRGGNRPRSIDARTPVKTQQPSAWHLVSEAPPSPTGWRLDLRLKSLDQPKFAAAVTLQDDQGIMSLADEYAVALVAHRSAVEFGPVDIAPL